MVLTFVINESIIHSIVNHNLYGERKDIMCKIYDSGFIGYPVQTKRYCVVTVVGDKFGDEVAL